jgi:hypothetical protein
LKLVPKFVLNIAGDWAYQSDAKTEARKAKWTGTILGASAVCLTLLVAIVGLIAARPAEGRTVFTLALIGFGAALLGNLVLWRSSRPAFTSKYETHEGRNVVGFYSVVTNVDQVAKMMWACWVIAAVLYVIALSLGLTAVWIALGEQPKMPA